MKLQRLYKHIFIILASLTLCVGVRGADENTNEPILDYTNNIELKGFPVSFIKNNNNQNNSSYYDDYNQLNDKITELKNEITSLKQKNFNLNQKVKKNN